MPETVPVSPEMVLMRTPGEGLVFYGDDEGIKGRRTVLGVLDLVVVEEDGLNCVIASASDGSDGETMAT
jgi:hypothetical protein